MASDQVSGSAESWATEGGDDVVRAHWHDPKVRRALLGLIFVVGVFVVAPVFAMFMNAR